VAAPVKGLIDTGALLALLDRADDWHEPCVEAFARARLPLGTTAAVLAELFHMLGSSLRELRAGWNLIRSGAIEILPVAQEDLPALERLMLKYHDCPMDFADATLVHAAEKLGLSQILTVDHDDFETYRIGPRKRFSIAPGRRRR
jgi:uncharacterized protein